MISVMSNGFEADRRNGSLEDTELRVSTSAIQDGGGLSLNSEEARVSMDLANSRVSDSQTRVFDNSRVLNVDGEENARVSRVNDEDGASDEQKGKVALVSSKIDGRSSKLEYEKPVLCEYDIMLSKFDEFASNWKCWTVGYGFEMGDMVWGKVKSHPWWPGQILSEELASHSVRRTKREGHVLVAFYGDSSYGWFDPAELLHFEPTFAEKSLQTNVKNFVKAVEEAVDEASRRSALGLVCLCRKRYNMRPASLNGFFTVDFSDYELTCTYSASKIKKARDSFQPKETLDFLRKLALKPKSAVSGDLNFIKKKATVLAYRKAVFEEYDPTYAEAFGVVPSKQSQELAQSFRAPSRAPLSGRLVLAETLGKGKSSSKSSRMKDQIEKDRYLFKRRDETANLKIHKVGASQAGSSDRPVHLDGSGLAGKELSSSAVDHLPSASTSIESSKQPSSQTAATMKEPHRQADDSFIHVQPSMSAEARLHVDGSQVNINSGSEKAKVRKRRVGELSGGSSPSTEKKKKKKKKALGLSTASDHVDGRVAVSSDHLVMEKAAIESVQAPSASREEPQMDNRQKSDIVDTSVPDPVATDDKIRIRSIGVELSQVLSDLNALALDPFYGAENKNLKTIQEVFLTYRSLVYQKSLALSAASENESSTPASKSPAGAPIADTAPTDNVRQTSILKPQKHPNRLDDPTKGGRKRSPSDRQEEIAAKKKKKISDLKVLAAEKKASLKASEVQQGDSKEIPAKSLASTPMRVSKPDMGKRKVVVEKVSEPTMLVMKFPPNGALPSIPELKARFARFGPMDHSATRVFWSTSTCRLVYQHRRDAVTAYEFAVGCSNLFGNTNVRCHIREVGAEVQDTDTTKVSREDVSVGTSAPKDAAAAADPRFPAAKLTSPPGQLRSILRKHPGEEGVTTNGGNGSNRANRVKFVLGGEDNNRGEQIDSKNNNVNNTSNIADGSEPSHSNINSFTKGIPQNQSSMNPFPSAQFAKAPNNAHYCEVVAQRNMVIYKNPMSVHEVDISQQMLSLLTKCNDVVTNLTSFLGYVPYHPL